MANVYVRSGAAGAGTGADWANAYTTLAAALTAKAAGDTFWVAGDHAETQATGITLTSPGTAANPCRVICVNHAGTVPPVSADLLTTGTITATAGAALTINGFVYFYGLTFSAGSGANAPNLNIGGPASSSHFIRMEACKIITAGTATGSRVMIGSSGAAGDFIVEWVNTTVRFGHVGHGIRVQAPLRWLATASALPGSVPTILFTSPNNFSVGPTTVAGVDLSAMGSGKSLVDVSLSNANPYTFNDCKLGASVGIATGSITGQGGTRVLAVNCDSADTNYRYFRQDYAGTITHETTIKRTGGASDGVTGFSRKFVSTANAKFYAPLVGPWFKFWNATLSSITVAVEIVTDNVTLTDAEAWVEVLHQGTSGYPLGVFENDRAADILATGANQTSSSETWTTTGLTTPVKQTLSKAVTPAEVGWIYARVVLAKASTTLYACPKILGTSTYQYMEEDGSIANGPTVSAGGGLIGGGNLSGGFL